MRKPCVVASVLNADLGGLREVCADLEEAGVDAIQWDVMDGHFVPDLTFGPGVIEACRAATTLPFEAHLMIEDPEPWIERYVSVGCACVIVHAEACRHLHRTLGWIKELDAAAGVALNPATPLDPIRQVVDLLDLVLVMTVNPGAGGQAYIKSMNAKIYDARAMLDDAGSTAWLEVDGGVSAETIGAPRSAGADRFIVGSALFRNPGGPQAAVAEVRQQLGDPVAVR